MTAVAAGPSGASDALVRFADVTVRYQGSELAAVDGLNLSVAAR